MQLSETQKGSAIPSIVISRSNGWHGPRDSENQFEVPSDSSLEESP